jgi:hypothetical protein
MSSSLITDLLKQPFTSIATAQHAPQQVQQGWGIGDYHHPLL